MSAKSPSDADENLGLGASLLLGISTLLIGLMMVLIATPEEGAKKMFFYGFAGFCFLITIACLAQRRAREFAGSLVGVCVFTAGLWYLGSMLLEGPGSWLALDEPSALQAILFLLVFGLPGAAYALRLRFGFRRSS
ncbi:MAG: hypothetical protein MEQ07_07665 [Aquimonas sp.]|nr:hypothetical protein [Aquimonas sp.]